MQQGADETVQIGAVDDLAEAFRAAGGGGVDVVVDPVWGEPAVAAHVGDEPVRPARPDRAVGGRERDVPSAFIRGKTLDVLGHTNFAVPVGGEEEGLRDDGAARRRRAGSRSRWSSVPLDDVPSAWERQRSLAGREARRDAVEPVAEPRLTLDPETFRRLGHRVVDALADRYAGLADAPAATGATRPEMEALLGEPLPEAGSDAEEVLTVALRDVLAYGLRTDHPRFFAYVPLPGNPLAPLADALASGHTVFAGTWIASPGAAMAELVTLGWLRDLLGLAPSTEGVFVSGGSAANLTALAVALHWAGAADRSRLVLYASGEAHSSVDRAARVVGVPLRRVAVDRDLRIDVADLDRVGRRGPSRRGGARGASSRPPARPGREPSTRCASCAGAATRTACGSTSTAPTVRPPRWSRRSGRCSTGMELADSVTVDPHKWLFQTPELGCLLVREGRLLPETFAVSPAYLRDAAAGQDEVNFSDRGINLTRQFSALKLWMSLKIYGAAAFREAIAYCLELAEHAQRVLEADERWEVVTPAQLGIVTFRLAGGPSADDRTRALVPALIADGFAVLSSTEVHGRVALRMCTDNPRTTHGDIEATLDRLAELAHRQR